MTLTHYSQDVQQQKWFAHDRPAGVLRRNWGSDGAGDVQ